MLCEKCQKQQGQIYVNRLIEGVLTEVFLCDDCLKENEILEDKNQTTNHMLNALLDAVNQSPLQVNWIKTTSCGRCGMTYGLFREIGKMGCSQCYETFGKRVETAVFHWHGHRAHVGKHPKQAVGEMVAKSELVSLQEALKRAVENEQFEEAAQIRDAMLAVQREHYQQEDFE